MKWQCPGCKVEFGSKGSCPYCRLPLVSVRSSRLALAGIVAAIIAACAIAIMSAGLVYSRIDLSRLKWYLSKSSFGGIYEVKIAPSGKRAVETSKETLSLSDCARIRALLAEKQYDALNRMAEDFQRNFLSDPSSESKIYEFFRAFAYPAPGYEDLLNAWAESTPSHYAPHVARAQYFNRMAGDSRGDQYDSKTSDEQFANMRAYFARSSKDLDAALAIDRNVLPTYLLRIRIHNAQGERAKLEALYAEAQPRFPTSFLFYNTMLWANTPKWGGSYPQMEKIAMDGYVHIQSNPSLYLLFGAIYAEQVEDFLRRKKYDEAIALSTRAISYGDYYEFYWKRSQCYQEAKNLDKALEDIDRSIGLGPTRAMLYRARTSIFLDKADGRRAVQEVAFLDKEFPGDADAGEWRFRAAAQLVNQGCSEASKDRLEEAVAKFGMAIEIKPEYAKAYYLRGEAYRCLNKRDLSLPDMRRGCELGNQDACKNLQ